MPSAPSEPAPLAPPAAPAAQSISRSDNHLVWSHNGEKLEVRWDGEFELNDTDTDIKSMTPGSRLRISDGGWFSRHSIEFTANASGVITRKYWVGSGERPFDPEGKDWLARMMPRFVRESGLGAKGRVARIYGTKGAPGVLAEISTINNNWVKRVYYTELLALDIPADARRQAIEQAGRDVTSDYELASLLISQASRLPTDPAVRKAYFDAARSIKSDYELRRVLSTGLKGSTLDNALLASVLDTSRSIDSDYEQASLLVQVATQQSIDGARVPFFAALDTVSSSYERGRVLQAVAQRPNLSGESLAAMLTAAGQISSDYEAAQFLLKLAPRSNEAALRAPFFSALDGIQSTYERGRVLKAVATQPELSNDTMLALLQAVRGMSGGYDASQVLQTLAAKHAITGAARDAYIDATEKLGDYEQGRALSALVKSDRARK